MRQIDVAPFVGKPPCEGSTYIVLGIGSTDGAGRILWRVRCGCGQEKEIDSCRLRFGSALRCWECRNKRIGERNKIKPPGLKNGKKRNAGGYVVLTQQKDHPNVRKEGTILEHVFVMSEHLGRPLRKGETVHHLGPRDDNRIEMLQLRQGAHGMGQAFECADCGSDRYDRDHDQCLQCMDCKSYRIKPIPLKGAP